MKRIILDTNFLLIPFKFKVDIFSELNRICDFNYRLFVLKQSIEELRKIIERQQSSEDKKAAQFGLKLIKLKNIAIIKSKNSDVDKSLLENVNKDTIIATLDLNLKKELLKRGAPVIILRQKKYLQHIGKLYK